MNNEVEIINNEIDILWTNYNNCRAHFPCVSPTMIGQRCVPTAPFYAAQGFEVTYVLNQDLTEDKINKLNEIGHWLNQNFIIRLCALLEAHHVLSNDIKIDFEIDGCEHLNIVRRLRNRFAHSSGRFNPDDKDDKKTMELIRVNLNIDIDRSVDWPLAINTVLQPLCEGCKRYVECKFGSA